MKMDQLSVMVGCKWVGWWTSGDKFVYVAVVKMEGRRGRINATPHPSPKQSNWKLTGMK